MTRLPLVISCGEPAGIGPEIIAKCWQSRKIAPALPEFLVIGDPEFFHALPIEYACVTPDDPIAEIFCHKLPLWPLSEGEVSDAEEQKTRIIFGSPNPEHAKKVVKAVERGFSLCRQGRARALITAPICKETLAIAGFEWSGHTEMLASWSQKHPAMMLAGPELRTVPVTRHVALSQAVQKLNAEMIIANARLAAQALREWFEIPVPRLAISGLNPHAGEGGRFGNEEKNHILPAIRELAAEPDLRVSGPHPACSLFAPNSRKNYDVAICMTHDQALIPVKTLDFQRTVNCTLGLDVVRTSPDHGTGFDIAGKNQADFLPMRTAIEYAHFMSESR